MYEPKSNKTKRQKRITALFASMAIATAAIPAPALAADFYINIKEETVGGKRLLTWESSGCTGSLGETPKVTLEVIKDGQKVSIDGQNQLEIKNSDAGKYVLNGTCQPSVWSAPIKLTHSVDISPIAEKDPNDGRLTLFFEKVGEGDDAKLTWRTTGCAADNKVNPGTLKLKLTRDGQELNIDGKTEYALKGEPAGNYTMEASCSYQWTQPQTVNKTIAVAGPAGEQPVVPTPDAGDAENAMTIKEAVFAESGRGRTLSWDVEGCSVLNQKRVRTSVLFNDKKISLNRNSRKDSVNASQWPTGKYTVKAECVSLNDATVFATQTKEVELSRANLPVTFAGEPLGHLIPRPGDYVQVGTRPTHNAITLEDKSVAAPFQPGETVKLFINFDNGERTEVSQLVADAEGHVETKLWIPFKENVHNFGIFAVGQTNNYQLDYQSVIAPTSGFGIKAEAVTGKNQDIRVISVAPADPQSDTAFAPNSKFELKILDPEGNIVQTQEVQATATGDLDVVVTLKEGLKEGRYTVLAPTVLSARGHYAAYFYYKNNKVWAQWEAPADEDSPVTPTPEGSSNLKYAAIPAALLALIPIAAAVKAAPAVNASQLSAQPVNSAMSSTMANKTAKSAMPKDMPAAKDLKAAKGTKDAKAMQDAKTAKAVAEKSKLANTGSPVALLAAMGLSFLVLGGFVLAFGRKKN
ncbi:LPXTG cell wall anchor domain-containing protein [Corynebacterium caspium]|uniref:LPXTG cell wall anchor domain-containing protein n=1 Tax=Corynebacterium caspium TaxID=234828 RepID=UPI00036560B5|nr:LPXTG cell wall anchor domain-containing protein [Corynebacterium caspium]WKD59142.1 hypothetical protein CCASP_03690 [Corynebacterium caspium DSM 44850]